MAFSIDEDRFNALPPSMGFDEEGWYHQTGDYGPHYSCVANGKRVCVWVSFLRGLELNANWHLSLAKPSYEFGERWSDKAEEDFVIIEQDPLLLMAAIYTITSEGNDEALHDL